MSEKLELQQQLADLAAKNAKLERVPNPDEALQNKLEENREHMNDLAYKIGVTLRPEWARDAKG